MQFRNTSLSNKTTYPTLQVEIWLKHSISLLWEVCYRYLLLRIITYSCTGGTSGSVLASRLAHSSPTLKVLLLEAGGGNADLAYRRWARCTEFIQFFFEISKRQLAMSYQHHRRSNQTSSPCCVFRAKVWMHSSLLQKIAGFSWTSTCL